MRSAIYEGVLTHRRRAPEHHFRMRVAMPLLFDDEVAEIVARHPLWSAERANIASVRRADFLGDPGLPIADAVRGRVADSTGRRPAGTVATLGHVRTWGWLFNPLAVHYCIDPSGEVDHAVLHVTNTPWKEEHDYVLGPPGTHLVDKAMHVSPFFGMAQRYRITYDAPGPTLRLHIAVEEEDEQVFQAGLHLRRREIDRRSLGRILWRYPMLTARVSMGIHTHALRLWRKGARYHPHPTTHPEVPRVAQDHRPDRTEEAA